MPAVSLLSASLLFLLPNARGAEPKSDAKVPSRVSALPSPKELPPFQLAPGFRIEVVAAEPLVTAPVALAFDERGRLFVAEMLDYPDQRERTPHLGRIRVLDDMDEEGRFQSATVYADDLPWPSAVTCYAGGIFVAATPDILYFKDTQRNGIADVRQVVLSGFGGSSAVPNSRALLNSFNWGLDNRIHGGAAGIGGRITAVGGSGNPAVWIGGEDFAFDPRTLALLPEAGPAGSGLSFDSRGRKFLCDFTHPLQMPMYDPRYLARNPFFAPPPELLDVASPATAVFRFNESPAARAAAPSHPSARREERSSDSPAPSWLTMARGCVVYRGSAFPSNFFDNVFIADPEAHVVHRAVLREAGLGAVAERPADQLQSEFLVSRDNAFRPMQLNNGPDGALYIADMQLDRGSGRIYRVVPESFKRPKRPRLHELKTYDLVALLAQPNGWHCDTAARLLCERQDPAAILLLSNMFNNSKLPLARLHALHALAGLGVLSETLVLRALKDGDERVREHAVLLSENLTSAGRASASLLEQLTTLAADPSIRVRCQLAFSAGDLPMPAKAQVLIPIIQRDLDNQWVRAAALSSLGEGAGLFLVGLADDPRVGASPAGHQFLSQLAMMIGLKGRLDEVTAVLAYVENLSPVTQLPFALGSALGEGLHRGGSSLELVERQNRLQQLFDGAVIAALNDSLPVSLRAEAAALLGSSPLDYSRTGDWLRILLSPAEPPALQSAAIVALGRCTDARAATDLIQNWPLLAPPLRHEVMAALLARSERAGLVLAALESGRIGSGGVSSPQLNSLRTHHDPAVRQRALQLLGPGAIQRPAAVERFLPALRLTGASGRGHDLFLARCSACHRLGGEGLALGPGLAGAKVQGKEELLLAILEPNLEVAAGYATCVVETKEGESMVGIKASENASTLTLRQPNGLAVVWSLADVESSQTQRWSLMPDGLEEGLAVEDMADLLDYVMTTPR